MRQAVILAGGKGTRLSSRLGGKPKPLIDVDGVPLLGRQLALLKRFGFDDVLLLVHHAAAEIEQYCRREEFAGIKIQMIDDGDPRGTAGAVLAALDRLADRLLVVYGDTLLDVDLDRFWNFHRSAKADVTLFLHPNDHPRDSDLVTVSESGMVTGFHPYPRPPGAWLPNLVNAALYMIERSALEPWRNYRAPSDFAKNLFPEMLAGGARIAGYDSYEYIKDIGTPERLDQAVEDLRSGKVARANRSVKQAAVFLDRDGTLNEDTGYIAAAENLKLFSAVPHSIRRFNRAEFRVVVVTNQSVLARGEATSADMDRIHARLEAELGDQGAFVDRIYVCPHHPDSGFPGEVKALKIQCDCRKPQIGLILRARQDLNIDLGRSWFIGDSTVDLLAARRAGLKSVLVMTGCAGQDRRYPVFPDFIARDLNSAAALILDVYPAVRSAIEDWGATIAAGDIVLVGGSARSGKSTLTGVLRSQLRDAGIEAEVLPLDSFIRDHDKRADGVLGRFDLPRAASLIAPWLKSKVALQVELPVYDRVKRQASGESVRLSLSPDTVLIVEGVPALALGLQTARRQHRLHVDAAEDRRRTRVIHDLIARGMSAEEATKTCLDRTKDESPFVEKLAESADRKICLDNIFTNALASEWRE